MGREIIFGIKDKTSEHNVLFENETKNFYVCGRDDATNFMANYISNHEYEEDSWEILIEAYSSAYNYILEELQEYYEKDKYEIDKAKETLSDLREARKHCAVYNEFVKFSEAMDDTHDWIQHNDWSRAGLLRDYLQSCAGLAVTGDKCYISIILSE